MALKDAIPTSHSDASVPPASMTSASPRWIILVASPSVCVDAAHAVVTVVFGPRRWNCIATDAPAMLGMIVGAYIGFSRPLVAKEIAPVVMSSNAPMPVPIATPTRKLSSLARSRPESASAMPEAATAICEKRAMRCAALRSRNSCGSKLFTWQANFVASRSVGKRTMGLAPLRPSIRPCQYSSTFLPRGLTVPIPVTTTRVRPFLTPSPPPPES